MGIDVVGAAALVAVLAVATVLGLWLQRRAGRVRHRDATADGTPSGWELAGTDSGGRRALLLQLSSPSCTPCRQAAVVLAGMAQRDAGLAHVEIDVADRVDVARALGVLRTPTTVLFDAGGTELARVSGVPRADELAAALPPAPPAV